jgi:hypothetical protein
LAARKFLKTFHVAVRLSRMGTHIRVSFWFAAFVIGSCLSTQYILAQAPAATTRLPISIPFDFAKNQVFLKVGINSSAPVWFVLDSGASGCVADTALAHKLGLKIEGERQGTGAEKGR